MAPSEADRAFTRFRSSGDPREIAVVFDATAAELLRVASHLVLDLHVAEDLVQATFLTALQGRNDYDASRRVLPWLLGILSNHARMHRKASKRQVDPDRIAMFLDAPDPAALAEQGELSQAVGDAIAKLPEPYRPVLTLHLRHGLTSPEIALALERPPGTVRTQVVRGLDLLRQSLPVGIAGLTAAILVSSRGLAAVRRVVVEAAGHFAPEAASAGLTVAGVIAMKKTLSILVAAVLATATLLVTFQLMPDDAGRPGPDHRAPPIQTAIEPFAPKTYDAAPAASAIDRDSVAAPGSTTGRAELVVSIEWADARAATAIGVSLMPTYGETPGLRERSLRTDTDGRAVFTDLDPGSYELASDRTAKRALDLDAGTTTVRLTIPNGTLVTGTVVDPAGVPAAGARIWLSKPDSFDDGYEVATADQRGEFSIRDAAVDRVVWATSTGYLPTDLVAVPSDSDHVELRFERRARLVRGTVIDDQGRPIEGAWLMGGHALNWDLRHVVDGEERIHAMTPPSRSRTDADGRFEVPVPATGSPLWVRAAGFAPVRRSIPRDMPDDRIEIRLTRGARLGGTARDHRRRPLAGVHIEVRHGQFDSAGAPLDGPLWVRSTTWTDGDGRYSLEGLGSGRAGLVALTDSGLETHRQVDLKPNRDLVWDPVLAPEQSIRGIVIDERGAPVAGVTIIAKAPNNRHTSIPVVAGTDGRFEIRDCPPALTYSLQAFHDSKIVASEGGIEVGDREVTLTIVPQLWNTGTLTATVVDAAGQPFEGYLLLLDPERSETSVRVESGRLEVTAPVAEYRVLASGQRFGPFRLVAGEPTDVGELRLHEGGGLRITYRRADGSYAWGAAKLLAEDGATVATAAVGEAGSTFRDVAPGSYTLLLDNPTQGVIARPVSIRAAATESIVVDVPPGVATSILLAHPDLGRSIGIRWVWKDATGEVLWRDFGRLAPGESTVFRRLDLPRGSYTLDVCSATGLRASKHFDVKGASTVRLTLQ